MMIKKINDYELEKVNGGGGDGGEDTKICPYCSLPIKRTEFSNHKAYCEKKRGEKIDDFEFQPDF